MVGSSTSCIRVDLGNSFPLPFSYSHSFEVLSSRDAFWMFCALLPWAFSSDFVPPTFILPLQFSISILPSPPFHRDRILFCRPLPCRCRCASVVNAFYQSSMLAMAGSWAVSWMMMRYLMPGGFEKLHRRDCVASGENRMCRGDAGILR